MGKGVPVWVIVVGLAIIVGGWMTCRSKFAASIADPGQWTRIDGAPLDAADDVMICRDCGGDLVRGEGYHYRCKKCGIHEQVRRDPETGKFIWED